MKNHANIAHPDMLEIFLVLNLRDVNLDQERELDMKEKKLMAHKQRVLQLSKKEKKVIKTVFVLFFICNYFFHSFSKRKKRGWPCWRKNY